MTKKSYRKIQQEIEKQSAIYLDKFAKNFSKVRDEFLNDLEQIKIPPRLGGYQFKRTLRCFCEDKIVLFTIEGYISCEGETLEVSPQEMFEHLAKHNVPLDDVHHYQK